MIEPPVCLMCKAPLTQKGQVLYCEKCGMECTLDEGVYDFLGDHGSYWGEISPEEMASVLEAAHMKGWRDAVRELGFRHPSLMTSVISNARVDWLFHCLDLDKVSSCLDIGSGWGANVFSLAKYYDEVWSLDSVKQRIAFQKIRQEQDGIKNIRFVRADCLRLPFPGEYFNLVSVNGVLEWIGTSDYSQNPKKLQVGFLREVSRVLKPDGCLYIGIENRFGLPFLLGARDHSGLPFTSILPRKLADLEVKLFRKMGGGYRQNRQVMNEWRSYRTYTYSFWGYKKILKEVGFNQVDLYWTLDYSHPKYAGRFDGESFNFLLGFLRKSATTGRLGSFLTLIGTHLPCAVTKFVLPFISPCFLIFAHKRENKMALFETKLLESGDHTSFVRISGSHGTNSKVSYFLLKDGKPCSILKFPRFKTSTFIVDEEAKMRRFAQIHTKEKVIDKMPIFIEQPIQGTPCLIYNLSHNQKVLNWLLDFQHKTQTGFWDFEQLEAKVMTLSHLVSEIPIDNKIRLHIRQRLELFRESLGKVKLPKNAEHGDFSSNNILIGNDNQVYVIDWEFYQDEGDPLFDLVYFILSSSAKARIAGSLPDDFWGRGKYSPILKFLISEFSKAKGLPSELVLQAVPYVILRRLHRAITGADNRQIDIASYITLLESWDKVCLPG